MITPTPSQTFDVTWKDLAGKLHVTDKRVEWEEANISNVQMFNQKRFNVPYTNLKELKIHKSIPKLRIELAQPTALPSPPANKQESAIDFNFTTIDLRNQCKELISRNNQQSKNMAKISPEERKKIQLLSRDPKLKDVYDELVGKGVISKQEFWTERKHLLNTKSSSKQQIGPMNALDTILDPNQKTWKMSPQLIRQIFVEYPGVEKAWKEKVPHEVSEEKFWELFKQSYYFHKGRPSMVSDNRAMQQGKGDIFHAFAKMDEKELEKDMQDAVVEKYVDLTRNESWGEGYGLKPDEMTVPTTHSMDNKLLKHFNQTSARVMKSYLGQKTKVVQQPNINDAMDLSEDSKDPEESRKHTIMEDLMDEDTTQSFVPLKIQDKHRYFEGLLSDKVAQSAQSIVVNCTTTEMLDAFGDEVGGLLAQNDDIAAAIIPSELSSTIAMEIINLVSQNDVALSEFHEKALPKDFQKQFNVCFALCAEVLRHLYSLLQISAKMWKKENDVKADKLCQTLRDNRNLLLSLQSNHQTKQLTNALIESIDTALDTYSRKMATMQKPAAVATNSATTVTGLQKPTIGQPISLNRADRSGSTTTSTITPNSQPRPALGMSISFSLGSGLKRALPKAAAAVEEEEDDVFGERPSKRIKNES